MKNIRFLSKNIHLLVVKFSVYLNRLVFVTCSTHSVYEGIVQVFVWIFALLRYKKKENTFHLYNFDPLKPHFYIVKLGFTGVYIIFLFLLKNIDCGYSLEPPRRGGSNGYPQSTFLSRNMKTIRIFYLKTFSFWW